MGFSRRLARRLAHGRRILVNGRPAHLARTLRPGDSIAVAIGDGSRSRSVTPVEMPLSILYEDNAVLAVDKPAGLLVHPTSPAHHETLVHGIAHHDRARGVNSVVRPVHRLDRGTSGVVLIARSAYAHQHLDRQLRDRRLVREYLALVEGEVTPDEGTIDAPIGRSRSNPDLRMVRSGGKPALTRYEVVERLPRATLLRLRLDTGRTHQIRVHLSHIGHPVLGDVKYGARAIPRLRRVALHSARVVFEHPLTGKTIELEAPLPRDIAGLLSAGRGEAGEHVSEP